MNTLKRMSWSSTGDLQQHLLTAGTASLGRTSNRAPSSPSRSPGLGSSSADGAYPFPSIDQVARLERTTLHRSLSALSNLLSALDEYRSILSGLASSQKGVAKAAKEFATCFGDKVEPGGRNEVIASALLSSVSLFEALQEIDSKHAKSVQREYENINTLSATFFKKIAREEKTLDESLSTLDGKMAKVTNTYERTRPVGSRRPNSLGDAQSAAVAHDKYINSLSALSSAVNSVKLTHAENTGERRNKASMEIVKGLCGIAEQAWRTRVDATKRGGQKVGDVVLHGSFCEQGMPKDAPIDRAASEEKRLDQETTRKREQRIESETSQAPIYTDGARSSGLNSFPSTSLGLQFPGRSNGHPFASGSDAGHSDNASTASAYQVYPGLSMTPQLQVVPQHYPQAILQQQRNPYPNERRPSFDHLSQRGHSHNGSLSFSPAGLRDRDEWIAREELQRITNQGTGNSQQPQSPVSLTTRWEDSNDNRLQPPPSSNAQSSNSSQTNLAESPMDPNGPTRANASFVEEPQRIEPQRMKRTDSTASERSFVAKMKEQYAQEKEKRSEMTLPPKPLSSERGGNGVVEAALPRMPLTSKPATPHARSNSRVSEIAKRYQGGARWETTEI